MGEFFQGTKIKMITYLVAGLIGILSVLFYYLVIKLQLFKSIKVDKIKLPAMTMVYTTYRGNYQKLMPTINQLKKDFELFFKSKSMSDKFKTQKFAGIYYDDPSKMVNPDEARAILGAVFSSSDLKSFDLEDFLKFEGKTLSYQVLQQASTPAFGAQFPLYNILSLCSAMIRGYPKIMAYGTEHKLLEKSKCSLEIYDWHGKDLTICFPYGKNSESMLFLSGYPIPEMKC